MVNFELYPHTVERKEMIEIVSFFSGQGLIRLFPCPHSSFILHYLLATRSSDTGLSRVKICYVVFEVLYLSSQHMEIHKHGAWIPDQSNCTIHTYNEWVRMFLLQQWRCGIKIVKYCLLGSHFLICTSAGILCLWVFKLELKNRIMCCFVFPFLLRQPYWQ